MGIFEAVSEFIRSVGFPIAVTCYTLYIMHENDKRYDEERSKLYFTYIQENTKALQQLIDKIGGINNEVRD